MGTCNECMEFIIPLLVMAVFGICLTYKIVSSDYNDWEDYDDEYEDY